MIPPKGRDILDAVQFATDANIPALSQVLKTGTLELELVLRILLTYLPECTEPSLYVGLLQNLISDSFEDQLEITPSSRASKELTEVEFKRRLQKLQLLPLSTPSNHDRERIDIFARFILDKAHRIDTEIGSLSFLQQLVEPFVELSDILRTWVVSVLLPLLRFNYEYYPQHTSTYSLESFESLGGASGVRELMSLTFEHEEQQEEPGRNLRGIVGPWMYGGNNGKRRKLLAAYTPKVFHKEPIPSYTLDEEIAIHGRSWSHVNTWILGVAERNFSRAVTVLEQWNGPEDVDYGGWASQYDDGDEEMLSAKLDYAQCGIAAAYVCESTSTDTWEGIQSLISRVAILSNLTPPQDLETEDTDSIVSTIDTEFLSSISKVHLLPGDLLDNTNPLTRPSSQSLELAFILSHSARILDSLGQPLAMSRVLSLGLYGLEADQKTILINILHGLQIRIRNDHEQWRKVRGDLLWLHAWNGSQQPRQGILCRLSVVDLECETLKSIVVSGHYKLATKIYCSSQSSLLPQEETEHVVLEVALSLYDNASNGNKARGGLKRASDIISAFGSYFPNSSRFPEITALILATHSLSFYSLTLQHGVPLLPVNIRAHPNPLVLIDKVLDQNTKSYTKLDDLLEIGRNLVRAGLVRPEKFLSTFPTTKDQLMFDVERRVIAKAIEASLLEEDFDTAYSYVVNRLSSPQTDGSVEQLSSQENVLWQAAYQAGRHRPKNDGGPSELRRLEQNMELLSQALQLAPQSQLEEVLATWRECEANMNVVLARETVEEKIWNDMGDRGLPGTFTADDVVPHVQPARETTRKAMNEEAPMGLFDVARGAAAALSKSAFPLRDQRQLGSARRGVTETGANPLRPSSPSSEGQDGEERVRKRDMVSNMVTGGLASGIGWVLGAPPPRND